MNEDWKDIKGYEGLYQVSNHGRVKSLDRVVPLANSFKRIKGKILKGNIGSGGYYLVSLSKNNIRPSLSVHQLVMEAFVGERPTTHNKRWVIDHEDANKLNNHISNLRYVTNRENVSRAISGKTSKYMGVHLSSTGNRWIATIGIHGKNRHLGSFQDEKKAAKSISR